MPTNGLGDTFELYDLIRSLYPLRHEANLPEWVEVALRPVSSELSIHHVLVEGVRDSFYD